MIRKGRKKNNLCNIAFFIHPMINFVFLMSMVAYLDRFSYILRFVDFCSMYNKTQAVIIGDHFTSKRILAINTRLAWKKHPDILN